MNFKKVLSFVLVIVMCISLFSGCGEEENVQNNTTSTTNPTATAEKTIALVAYNENMAFWQNVKNGAEEAAKKYGFKLNYVGLDENQENNATSHITSLEKLFDNDVSGVVVTPIGDGYAQVFSRFYDEKIPVVQIDSVSENDIDELEGKNKNPIVSTVSTDYKGAGALCAEKMFEEIKEDIKNSENSYLIGVIRRENEKSDEEKANGFIEKFTELADADENTKGKYKIEAESEAKHGDSLNDLIEADVKAVFMAHSDIADEISDIVFANKEQYKEIIFCGFDSGAKQVKWLSEESGAKFIGAVAQDSFDLGYNAVEQCIFAVQGKDVKDNVGIEGQWYDKSNVDKMKQDSFVFEK